MELCSAIFYTDRPILPPYPLCPELLYIKNGKLTVPLLPNGSSGPQILIVPSSLADANILGILGFQCTQLTVLVCPFKVAIGEPSTFWCHIYTWLSRKIKKNIISNNDKILLVRNGGDSERGFLVDVERSWKTTTWWQIHLFEIICENENDPSRTRTHDL